MRAITRARLPEHLLGESPALLYGRLPDLGHDVRVRTGLDKHCDALVAVVLAR